MGCHVVAISRSDAKRAEALRFGASEYHIFQPGGELNFEPVKHLLLCGSGGVDYAWSVSSHQLMISYRLTTLRSIIPLMEIHGSIYPLTLEFSPSSIPSFPMIAKGLRVQGSMVASRHSLRGLLQFAAEKQVVPSTMKFPLTCDGVENAMKTLREGRMRYRGVLVRP
jgi:D-arabinose 1-dehydrogenase-like Zn-dependent alcohol dehydrogenase